jgi:hypothetical protein
MYGLLGCSILVSIRCGETHRHGNDYHKRNLYLSREGGRARLQSYTGDTGRQREEKPQERAFKSLLESLSLTVWYLAQETEAGSV